jgi:hypothetical protein
MPLLWIFALQSDSWAARGAYAGAGVLIIIDGVRATYGQRKKGTHTEKMDTVEDKGNEVSGYLATYVLPFLSGPPTSWWKAAADVVYFVVAWSVFVNSDLLFINPTLYLLGWRVFRGRRGQRSSVILAKRPPMAGEQFDAVTFAGGLVRIGH